MRASGGGGGGGGAGRMMNCEGRVSGGAEVGCGNVRRGWGCVSVSVSGVEGRGNGMSGRWRGSCHGAGVSENGAENDDTVDAGEGELLWFVMDVVEMNTHGSATAAPAVVPWSVVVAYSTPASSATATPPPATTVRPLRALSLANFVESLPAITLY